jgi:hypothetical protein
MNSMFRLMALCGISCLMGACATKPAPVAPPPPAAVAAAPSGNDTSGAGTTVNRIYLEDKTLTNDEVKALFAQGYKPTSRNGEVYYCRKEAQLGTRFEHMTCRTADQMKQIAQQSKDMAAEKQRMSTCSSQGGSC